jgi:hypothetical protein
MSKKFIRALLKHLIYCQTNTKQHPLRRPVWSFDLYFYPHFLYLLLLLFFFCFISLSTSFPFYFSSVLNMEKIGSGLWRSQVILEKQIRKLFRLYGERGQQLILDYEIKHPDWSIRLWLKNPECQLRRRVRDEFGSSVLEFRFEQPILNC